MIKFVIIFSYLTLGFSPHSFATNSGDWTEVKTCLNDLKKKPKSGTINGGKEVVYADLPQVKECVKKATDKSAQLTAVNDLSLMAQMVSSQVSPQHALKIYLRMAVLDAKNCNTPEIVALLNSEKPVAVHKDMVVDLENLKKICKK